MKKVISKKLMTLKKMPPLHHTLPGEEFDIKKSAVIRWAMQDRDVLNYLWDQLKQSGLIVYDQGSGTWKGIDFDD